MYDLQTIFQVLIMAIAQGIGEFLPISSSGHLLVLSRLFHMDDSFTLSILLHAGTLLSVLVFFSRQLWDVVAHRQRAILLIIVGTIPTVIVAFAIMKYFSFIEESLLATGIGFVVTGILLLVCIRRKWRTDHELYYDMMQMSEEEEEASSEEEVEEIEAVYEDKTIETTTIFDALIIGLAQGIAAIPGLSRSGTTISMSVARRLSQEWAAEFSFFLSIPVIAGGAALEIIKIVKNAQEQGLTWATAFQSDPNLGLYAGGAIVSFIVGWISLYSLMHMLKSGKLHYFAYWLFLIGPVSIGVALYEHWPQIAELFQHAPA